MKPVLSRGLRIALLGTLAAGAAAPAVWAAGNSSGGWNSQPQQQGSAASSSEQWSQSDVRGLQNKLKQQGYDVGQVDGRMGPNTQQALRQFQEDKGLQASGQPDAQTMAALNGNPGGTQQGQLPSESGSRGNSQTGGGTSASPGASPGNGMMMGNPSGSGTQQGNPPSPPPSGQ